MRRVYAVGATAFALVLCAAGTARGQLDDSPWPMLGGGPRHTGRSARKGPTSGRLAWSYETRDSICSSPAVGSAGVVYVGSVDCSLYCFSTGGSFSWSYDMRYPVLNSPALGGEPLGFDGYVHVGTPRTMFALRPNGTLSWSYDYSGTLIESSPVIGDDGQAYIGCRNRLRSYAWSYAIDGWLKSCPAVAEDGRIFAATMNATAGPEKMYAFNPNGTLSWSYAVVGEGEGAPSIGPDGTVHVGSRIDVLWAFRSNGTVRWSYSSAQMMSSPAVGGEGRIYAGTLSNRILALDSSGILRWSYACAGQIWASPAVDSVETVYTTAHSAVLFQPGQFFSILSDGSFSWSYTIGLVTVSSPAVGADGRIYVGCADNRLYAFEGPPPTPTPAPTPTPTATPPIDLTADKAEFGTTDSISVTANVWPLTVPCYPFVRVLMADGSTLYYQTGVGFTASPTPYLGFAGGAITTSTPILGYPALSANFSGIAAGTYYLEGGAVDMTQTTSASNLVYFGTVDRETLTVR